MEPTVRSVELFGTAAAHATRDVPIADPGEMADDVLARMRGGRFASAAVIAVCDGTRLAGLITIENLLAAPTGTAVGAVMDPDPPTIAGHKDQEAAVWEALRHEEPGLAVVDADGRWLGLIPPRRLLTVLLQEHDEDVARLSGYLKSATGARTATVEPIARRLWHRLPWLLVGLAGAMLAAGVVDIFHAELEREVLVAFFIPGVVYLADAVGTQTEALVIRGLAVGVGVRGIVHRESVTGLLIGLLIAVVSYPLTLMFWGAPDVSLAVAISLLAACSVAAVVAMGLPWTMSKLKIDPAFGAGPLATVIQDLLSILIYLGVTALVVA
ncbi:magnesium transporter [Nocardia gipuzkoensis]|uniref:magnesium transporter n=1 Tax=Nocardia gipuzkoensis TaxID=2749991 RepID=UPI001E43026C|nr:magnesium transporter [Nocardia gipuzkoensis]UGT67845.1 magnesium transporter [Nocardia gipuzkoensis]